MRKYALALYLILSFALAWAIVAWLFFSGRYLLTAYLAAGFSACMLAPTVAVILTKLIARESWRGLPLRPRFKGNLRVYLTAWFGPTVLTALGAAFYFIMNMDQFDASGGGTLTAGALLQLIGLLIAAPLLNVIPCAGEEIGWRGYLLPKLLVRYGMKKALIFSGLIWGLWHAPMIALGHNYGTDYPGWPWLGILAMCVFCVVMGCLLSYLALRSGSVWPAALAHGALNGSAGLGLYFVAAGSAASPFIGPLPTGVIGGAFFILAAMNCFSYLCDHERKFTPSDADEAPALPNGTAEGGGEGNGTNSGENA